MPIWAHVLKHQFLCTGDKTCHNCLASSNEKFTNKMKVTVKINAYVILTKELQVTTEVYST